MSILGTVFSCTGETHLLNISVLPLLILTGCAPASLNMAPSPSVRGFVNSCNSDNAAAALSLPLTAWVGCGRGGRPFHRPVHPSFYRDLQLPKHDLRSCKCLCSSPSPTLSPQFLVILSDIGRQIVPSHRVPSSTVHVTGCSHLSIVSSLDFGHSEIRPLLYLDLKSNKLDFLGFDASRMHPSKSVLLVCASLAQSSFSFAILRPLLLARFVKSPSFFEEKKVGSLWRLWRARGWATTRNVTSVFFAAHPLPPFSS